MQIKTKDIEISQEKPFQFDLLDREKEITNLTQMLNTIDGSLVLSIDSPWGTGKTTFVRLWQAYLQSKNINSVYFNAWESDYAEDPLIPLVSVLDEWLTKQDDHSRTAEVWKKTKSLLPTIAKSTAGAIAKAVTLGGLDVDKEYEKVAADLAGGLAGDLVESFNLQSKAIDSFKINIEQILKTLDSSQNKLFIFVDELDRCRPSYAIELLERIKHLFGMDKIVFILSTDLNQLSHSICAVYGNKFDSRKYLQRFIDLDYSLKEPSIDAYIASLFDSLAIKHYVEINENEQWACAHLQQCCQLVVKRFSLSLREINLLLMRMRVILATIPKNQYVDSPLIISLLILKQKNAELYLKYIADVSIANEVIEYMEQGLANEDKFEFPFCLLAGYLIAPNGLRYNGPDLELQLAPYKKVTEDDSLTYSDPRKLAADKIISIATKTRNYGGFINIEIIKERIELLHSINIEN